MSNTNDLVSHPVHYTGHPSGVECITVTEHMSFNLGNAVKYLWRAGSKGDAILDLKKAEWYVQREITRLLAAVQKKQEAGKPPIALCQLTANEVLDEYLKSWRRAREE